MFTRHRQAAIVATTAALPIALLAGALLFMLLGGFHTESDKNQASKTEPVHIAAMPNADLETARKCSALIASLPHILAGQNRRQVLSAAKNTSTRQAAAWGDPAIVLRCAVGKPEAFTSDAQLLGINGVEWVTDEQSKQIVWTAVSLAAYVEITVPSEYQDIATTEVFNPLAQILLKEIGTA